MPIYIVPSQGDFDTLTERCSRAGVPMETTRTAAQFVVASMGKTVAVVVVEELTIALLANHITQFFDQELPLVMFDVPGLVYPPTWMRHAATFPVAGFSEFEKTTSKSGHTAFTMDQARGKRDPKAQEHSPETFLSVLSGSKPLTGQPVAPTDPTMDDSYEG